MGHDVRSREDPLRRVVASELLYLGFHVRRDRLECGHIQEYRMGSTEAARRRCRECGILEGGHRALPPAKYQQLWRERQYQKRLEIDIPNFPKKRLRLNRMKQWMVGWYEVAGKYFELRSSLTIIGTSGMVGPRSRPGRE